MKSAIKGTIIAAGLMLAVAPPAQSQMLPHMAVENASDDYLTDAAYFHITAEGLSQTPGMEETGAEFEALGDTMMTTAYLLRATNHEIPRSEETLYRLIGSSYSHEKTKLLDEIEWRHENIAIISEQHLNRCIAMYQLLTEE